MLIASETEQIKAGILSDVGYWNNLKRENNTSHILSEIQSVITVSIINMHKINIALFRLLFKGVQIF